MPALRKKGQLFVFNIPYRHKGKQFSRGLLIANACIILLPDSEPEDWELNAELNESLCGFRSNGHRRSMAPTW